MKMKEHYVGLDVHKDTITIAVEERAAHEYQDDADLMRKPELWVLSSLDG